jgi:aldehyde dehydrogenase (NAD+)
VAPAQLETITGLVERAREEGATVWQPSWASALPAGCFYPPTLIDNIAPACEIAQIEVFGPVLATMTFRTRDEAVALANNTPYGLAASVWSEDISMAIDVARAIKAGTVWINATNLFDAASGFGGYRESGFGREGGREGLFEYLRPAWTTMSEGEQDARVDGEDEIAPSGTNAMVGKSGNGRGRRSPSAFSMPPLDRTPKLFIGGKQVRPDSGYSRLVIGVDGATLGEVGEGNRKDIRNAVEAAAGSTAWTAMSGHARAQVLYYIAENLAAREQEFACRLQSMTGGRESDAGAEVETAISRLFSAAAWADKYDGLVHGTPLRGLTAAVNEPIGMIGIVADDVYPLLQFVSLVAPAIALGNRVVAVPSELFPLAATDLYQVFETSDVPAGVVNIVTGKRDTLAQVLADHDGIDALWYAGSAEGVRNVELASAGNLKRTWIVSRPRRDWLDPEQGEGEEFLREATQVKNIWIPAEA